jgi:hypothetical protein
MRLTIIAVAAVALESFALLIVADTRGRVRRRRLRHPGPMTALGTVLVEVLLAFLRERSISTRDSPLRPLGEKDV